MWIGIILSADICSEAVVLLDLSQLLGTVARIRCGVDRSNKFVLLDMTEEPEAKKAYSIQHKRNLMER